MEYDFNNGRIRDIINAIKTANNVQSLDLISAEQKLEILCKSIDFTAEELDLLIASNSPVIRTIKGHAFERVFDELIFQNGHQVVEVGGDNGVDRVVNGYNLQLKTPNKAGTKNGFVEYKTHKTHGAKSVQESEEYLYEKSKFADFFVGLVSYNPFQVMFISRENLPSDIKFSNRIKSPFKVELDNEGINAFHLIGLDEINTESINEAIKPDIGNELLPRSSSQLGLKSSIILDVILNEQNFRIWDMNMRGFAREYALRKYFIQEGIKYDDPKNHRKERHDKADKTIFYQSTPVFLQLKGITLGSSKLINPYVLGVETQLSRGRVNDHPTQSRLYLESDFEYIIVALDPCYVKKITSDKGDPIFEWRFYAVSVKELNKHPKFPRRVKSLQKFIFEDLENYRINDNWLTDYK